MTRHRKLLTPSAWKAAAKELAATCSIRSVCQYSIRQLPYGVVPDRNEALRDIFILQLSIMPALFNLTLVTEDQEEAFQKRPRRIQRNWHRRQGSLFTWTAQRKSLRACVS